MNGAAIHWLARNKLLTIRRVRGSRQNAAEVISAVWNVSGFSRIKDSCTLRAPPRAVRNSNQSG